jgi:hypothetical protein
MSWRKSLEKLQISSLSSIPFTPRLEDEGKQIYLTFQFVELSCEFFSLFAHLLGFIGFETFFCLQRDRAWRRHTDTLLPRFLIKKLFYDPRFAHEKTSTDYF